jgi:uncharacterized protein YndB with AHSA1/START domain
MTFERLGDLELRFTKAVEAPRSLVWKAHTTPTLLQGWWGPQGFSNVFHAFGLRPGGQWRFHMIGPEGERFANHSEFQEIRPGELLRFEHQTPHFFTTVRFSDEAGGWSQKCLVA